MFTLEIDGRGNYRVRASNGYLLGLFIRHKNGRKGRFLANRKGRAKLDDDGHDRWEDMQPIASAQFFEGDSFHWPGL